VMRNILNSNSTPIIKLIILALLMNFPVASQTKISDSTISPDPRHVTPKPNGPMSPSEWIMKNKKLISSTESTLLQGFDSSFMINEYAKQLSTLELTENEFNQNQGVIRLRYLVDLNSKLQSIRKQLEVWTNRIKAINYSITSSHNDMKAIQEDSMTGLSRIDSIVWMAYRPEFDSIKRWTVKVDTLMKVHIDKFINIENKLTNLSFRTAETQSRIQAAIREEEESYFTRRHPPVWQLNGHTYPDGFGKVFMKTLYLNLDSLAFYGKHAYIRAILFRLFILCITLFPIWYFKRIRKEGAGPTTSMKQRFMHKHTAKAASAFGLILAPFVFIDSPLILLEVILITLVISTSLIFLAEHPEINKRAYFMVMGYFILLKFFDLFISVTLTGRIVTLMSILLLIPLWNLLKSVRKLQFRSHLLPYIIIYLTMIQLAAGWILSTMGYYRLGRTLIVGGFNNFYLAIILHVGLYALIDFIMILSDLYNRRDSISKVSIEQVYIKLVRIFSIPAIIFWIASFLLNANAFDFISGQLASMMAHTFTLGNFHMRLGTVVIFMTFFFAAIYFSGLLKGLFYDEVREKDTNYKTSMGSYVVLLRLFIIGSGFIIGMIASGIPLNNINLIIGGLGVGIGFGLQNIIANLVSGVLLAFEKPIYVGDLIEVDGIKGRVSEIGLRATIVSSSEGAEYIIPNADLTSKFTKNWTLSNKQMRVDTSISTALDQDPEKVIKLIKDRIISVEMVDKSKPSKVSIKEIRFNSIVFNFSFWVHDIKIADAVRTEVLMNINEAFSNEGIKYPKPGSFTMGE
jgi:small-conductance mechanosensitive channel